MVEQGVDRAGAVKPAAAAEAAVARRARLEGAGPVDHHRSRNEGAAGRPRSPRPGSWFDASPDCSLRTDCAFPGPGHEPRFHHATRSAASPHIRWVSDTRTKIPHARGRGARKGGAILVDGVLQPGPPRPPPARTRETGPVPVRGRVMVEIQPSGRRPPEQRPGWHTATARPAACGRQQRSRSGACARARSRRARRTSG